MDAPPLPGAPPINDAYKQCSHLQAASRSRRCLSRPLQLPSNPAVPALNRRGLSLALVAPTYSYNPCLFSSPHFKPLPLWPLTTRLYCLRIHRSTVQYLGLTLAAPETITMIPSFRSPSPIDPQSNMQLACRSISLKNPNSWDPCTPSTQTRYNRTTPATNDHLQHLHHHHTKVPLSLLSSGIQHQIGLQQTPPDLYSSYPPSTGPHTHLEPFNRGPHLTTFDHIQPTHIHCPSLSIPRLLPTPGPTPFRLSSPLTHLSIFDVPLFLMPVDPFDTSSTWPDCHPPVYRLVIPNCDQALVNTLTAILHCHLVRRRISLPSKSKDMSIA